MATLILVYGRPPQRAACSFPSMSMPTPNIRTAIAASKSGGPDDRHGFRYDRSGRDCQWRAGRRLEDEGHRFVPRKLRGPSVPQSTSSINYRLGSLYSVITAFLYATQEPFSFPAAKHLSTLQFVCLTQISLLISIPLLTGPPASRRDFVALFRKPANYGYLAVIFAIGMSGLLLYNFGLSNAHPIIISAILNLSPFWAALVALLISRVPIPISPAIFFGCFAGAFTGAMAVAWSQLGDANKPTLGELADNFVHGSWVYAIPVPLCSALGGTLVGKWFAKYNESAAIAANFLFANIILIPSCLVILYLRSELNFDQLQAMILMIVGTILASSVGRVFYQISLTVTGGDNGFVAMFWNLVPALTALVSLILSRWIADEHFAINPTFVIGSLVIGLALLLFSLEFVATTSSTELNKIGLAETGPAGRRGGGSPLLLRFQCSKWCCKRGLILTAIYLLGRDPPS